MLLLHCKIMPGYASFQYFQGSELKPFAILELAKMKIV